MILAADIPVANMVLIAGLLLVAGILLWRSNRHFAQQTRRRILSDELRPAKPDAPASHPLPPAAERWEVEMHELGRDLLGRIDTKMGLLQQFILEADRAALRLERALAASRPCEASSAPDVAAPAGPASTPGVEDSAERCASPRHEEILTLSDYGFSVEDIVQRTGTPVGEVELTLSLRGKRP